MTILNGVDSRTLYEYPSSICLLGLMTDLYERRITGLEVSETGSTAPRVPDFQVGLTEHPLALVGSYRSTEFAAVHKTRSLTRCLMWELLA